jgi:hypothetical protein
MVVGPGEDMGCKTPDCDSIKRIKTKAQKNSIAGTTTDLRFKGVGDFDWGTFPAYGLPRVPGEPVVPLEPCAESRDPHDKQKTDSLVRI